MMDPTHCSANLNTALTGLACKQEAKALYWRAVKSPTKEKCDEVIDSFPAQLKQYLMGDGKFEKKQLFLAHSGIRNLSIYTSQGAESQNNADNRNEVRACCRRRFPP